MIRLPLNICILLFHSSRLKDRIEEKYAASDGRKEYYTAQDGSIQELTKEKELEMLDKVFQCFKFA